jgi:molybdate transport system substrate-binding protein
MKKRLFAVVAWALLAATPGVGALAQAPATPPLEVMSSGGFAAAYSLLAPKYTAASGQTLHISWGASMGNTPTAIPLRLQRGEPGDVVIMVKSALDALVVQGKVLPDSETDFAQSRIGMAVKSDRPFPDISTPEHFVAVLRAAKSIDYSDSASGVYLSTTLFPKLGLGPEMKTKAKMIPGDPVAPYIVKDDAELGFQQIAELLPTKGVNVKPIPESLQLVTIYAAGVVATSKHPAEARALIRYLASPAVAGDVKSTGLDPIVRAGG